jgi:hypothetical protein
MGPGGDYDFLEHAGEIITGFKQKALGTRAAPQKMDSC